MKRLNEFTDVILRYSILVLVAIPNLWLFYFIFTPLTTYAVYFVLNNFFDVILIQPNFIIINGLFQIELIEACIAGAAYYFLLILNLSMPKVKNIMRIKMILFAFSSLFVLNVARILVLTLVFLQRPEVFAVTHKIFWYSLSTVFVVAIWFAEVKIFKIKEIPFYSDLKYLYRKSSLRR